MPHDAPQDAPEACVKQVSELIGTSSDYDLVMEGIEGFLQIVNAHTSGLREFLGIDEGKAEQVN